MTIGTCFTLFVVPAVYMLIASDRRRLNVVAATAVPAAAHPSA
jgi:hypothetical protein